MSARNRLCKGANPCDLVLTVYLPVHQASLQEVIFSYQQEAYLPTFLIEKKAIVKGGQYTFDRVISGLKLYPFPLKGRCRCATDMNIFYR